MSFYKGFQNSIYFSIEETVCLPVTVKIFVRNNNLLLNILIGICFLHIQYSRQKIGCQPIHEGHKITVYRAEKEIHKKIKYMTGYGVNTKCSLYIKKPIQE